MILVTGANGFVGTSLCRRLVQKGKRVRGAVRTAEALTALPPEVELAFVADLADQDDWKGLLHGVDTVIHLAARVPERWVDRLSLSRRDFYLVNVEATRKLAFAALQSGVQRLIFLSTAQVHGAGRREPYRESDPFLPESVYAESKCRGEEALEEFMGVPGLEIIVLRPPIVYGPDVRGNFARLLNWAKSGIPLPFQSIVAPRSMIYVENLAAAIDFIDDHHGAVAGNYLLKDGEDISLAELVSRLSSLLGVKAKIFSLPSFLNNKLGRINLPFCVDDRLFRQKLGWIPPHSIEAGLQETVRWSRQVN